MEHYINIATSITIPVLILLLDKLGNNNLTYVLSIFTIISVWLWYFISKKKQPYKNTYSFLSDKGNYDTIINILNPKYINKFFKEFSYDHPWEYEKLDEPLSLIDSEIKNIKFHNIGMEQRRKSLIKNIDDFISYKGNKTCQSGNRQTICADKYLDPKKYNEVSEALFSLSKEAGKAYEELREEWRTVESEFLE